MGYNRIKPIDILAHDEIRDMVYSIEGEGLSSIRTRALLMFLGATGLRISEALQVRPWDIDWENERVSVRFPKRDPQGRSKQRWIKLFDTEGYPRRWIEVRDNLALPADAPLFCAFSKGVTKSPGGQLDRSDVAKQFKRIARDLGLQKRLHCHVFRHSLACNLYHAGAPMSAIQAQLGHSSPLTTQYYLDSIGASDAIAHLDAITL